MLEEVAKVFRTHARSQRHAEVLAHRLLEANVPGAPDAADGAYPGVSEALVRGVIAASDEARRARLGIRVGFNWAYRYTPQGDQSFWVGKGTLKTAVGVLAIASVEQQTLSQLTREDARKAGFPSRAALRVMQ